jgi:hypothetical protein
MTVSRETNVLDGRASATLGRSEASPVRAAERLDLVEIAELRSIADAAERWVLSPADGYKAERRRDLERLVRRRFLERRARERIAQSRRAA